MRRLGIVAVLVVMVFAGCGNDETTAPTPPSGACCLTNYTCVVTTQANCPGTWTAGGVCTPSPCPPICAGPKDADNFEDGRVVCWETWSATGTTDNEVGPGSTLTAEGGVYARDGSYGLRARRTSVPYVDLVEMRTNAWTSPVRLSFDVRPFIVTSGSTHSQVFLLSQGSARDSEVGSGNLGVQFTADGRVLARSPGIPQVGTYTRNQWCHVEINVDPQSGRFSLDVTGPGIAVPIHREVLECEEGLSAVNYFLTHCDQAGPNEFALDNLRLVAGDPISPPQPNGMIVAWGRNEYGQCNVPAPDAGFVTIAARGRHSLGLNSDGSIVAWGWNDVGQCNVPAPNTGFSAIAAGWQHGLGLKSNGSIVAWGANNFGQCSVPAPNTGFVAIAGGASHCLGLTSSGTIVAWGDNGHGQCFVPAPNTGFVEVAAGGWHSLGLTSSGTIVAWGANDSTQCNVPAPNTGFVAVAGGGWHCLGLTPNGTIVAWGANGYGQCNVPLPNTGFVAVAGGYSHSLGLKADGTIVAWGDSSNGECNIPSPNIGFAAVAAGRGHSLGLRLSGLMAGSNGQQY